MVGGSRQPSLFRRLGQSLISLYHSFNDRPIQLLVSGTLLGTIVGEWMKPGKKVRRRQAKTSTSASTTQRPWKQQKGFRDNATRKEGSFTG